MIRPRGFTSVMANRQPTAPDDLEYFPTPPWGTRALFPFIRELSPSKPRDVRDPCCGEGIMSEVLREEFDQVWASDVFDYGYAHQSIEDYLDASTGDQPCDWMVANPPFSAAVQFVERGLREALMGVAILQRLQFAEGGDRYDDLYSHMPPHLVALFVDRLPMHKGEWKPKGRTATAYAWFIWLKGNKTGRPADTRLRWIPRGSRARLTHPDDISRFARVAPAPLLES